MACIVIHAIGMYVCTYIYITCISKLISRCQNRIEDVSKNHQRQRFSIKIAPDTFNYPLNNDISADVCDPIEVRSKPKKKKDRRSGESTSLPAFKRRALGLNVPVNGLSSGVAQDGA